MGTKVSPQDVLTRLAYQYEADTVITHTYIETQTSHYNSLPWVSIGIVERIRCLYPPDGAEICIVS